MNMELKNSSSGSASYIHSDIILYEVSAPSLVEDRKKTPLATVRELGISV